MSCRDLPELLAHGSNFEHAMQAAQRPLDELFATYVARDEMLPIPSARRIEECTVCLSVRLIVQAAQRTAPFPP